MKLLEKARHFSNKTAIIDQRGKYTYTDLLAASEKIASHLIENHPNLKGARIAFMITPGFDYVKTQWGIWRGGGIAVPLCLTHPVSELDYVINNAACSYIICENIFKESLQTISEKLNIPLITINDIHTSQSSIKDLKFSIPEAIILYTSGTTSKPKGVVITHNNIEAQVEGMIKAWGWTENDRILSVLPLHHVHGITNVVTTALYAGATIDFLPKFDAMAVWDKFLHTDISLFMAVPTIYYKLIEQWEVVSEKEKQKLSTACKKMRLMISGSAALPVSMLEKWKNISGHTLLERYGMTEIGMALSNPLDGVRKPGHVGVPMPGVSVKLVDENMHEVKDGESGQILVKGKNVFKKYWKEPEITEDSFHDGWFKTGDMAVNDGYYKIIGRASVDIIKSGGYKISALEIEEVLRQHPHIKECAVVGLPDEQWGEIVAAALQADKNIKLSLEELTGWAKDKLAPYKIPRSVTVIDDLPRNALGKVVKPEVKNLFNKS